MTRIRDAACFLLACGVASAGAQWRLDYEEVFAQAGKLNSGFWATESGFLRNQEMQYYTPANVVVRDGMLSFMARKEQVPNAAFRGGGGNWRQRPATSRFTSGSIASRGTLHYGRIEIVARSPSGAGVWPAIWLVHESPGQYGEIDIYEAVGKHPDTAFAGVHWGREPLTRKHRNGSKVIPGLEGTWRTHAVEWTPQRIRLSVDGVELFSFDPSEAATGGLDPLRQPMRLHMNLALGGTWGGPLDEGRLPASFDVRSIRIWSWQPQSAEAVAALPQRGATVAPPQESLRPPETAAVTAGEPPKGIVRWGR